VGVLELGSRKYQGPGLEVNEPGEAKFDFAF
jgi:hypothetical protein